MHNFDTKPLDLYELMCLKKKALSMATVQWTEPLINYTLQPSGRILCIHKELAQLVLQDLDVGA